MAISVVQTGVALGAEIHGVDLAQPIDDDTFGQIRDAFYRHAVIIFRGCRFNDEDHIRFSSRFGALRKLKLERFLRGQHSEIFVVSNILEDGKYIGVHDAGTFWHSDGPFQEQPHGPSALHALEVPMQDGRPLGDTLFASTSAAYDALPLGMKHRIDGLKAVNSLLHRYEKAVGTGIKDSSILSNATETQAIHPVVRIHSQTGRKCLYVSEGFTSRIVDMPEDESRALLDELTAHCVKPEFRYRHSWQVDDLVMWDNCATQHKATFDYQLPQRRLMHRTTLVS
jgi:taurine dioxygenase